MSRSGGPGWFGVIVAVLLALTLSRPGFRWDVLWEQVASLRGAILAGVFVFAATLAVQVMWRQMKRWAMQPETELEHMRSHAREQLLGNYLSEVVHEHVFRPCDDPSCKTVTCWCGQTMPVALFEHLNQTRRPEERR